MFRKYWYFEGLTNLRFSTQGFYINYLGQIKDKMGNDIPREKDVDGHWVVEVDSWNGLGKYRIIDLMTFQFKNISIPRELLGEIVSFVIDGDKDNVHANNLGYRFRNGKLEVPNHKGFYYIPSFTGLGINEKLELINIKSGKKISWYVTKSNKEKNIKGGYYVADGKTSNGKFSRIGRHRAVSLVFKEYPDNCDTLVVNHIDGVPGNDFPDNLEWVTRGQNNLHAYQNDLKNQHMRVLVRDVLTGEVTEYYSISETARQLGCSTDETIRQRIISSPFGKVFSDGTQVKLKSDERDWVIPEDPEKAVKEAQSSIPIKVRRCSDLKEFYFDNIAAAARGTGVKRATVGWRINYGNRRVFDGFQFSLADDDRPWPDFTEEKKYLQGRPVDVRNLRTGEVFHFNNSAAAVSKFGFASTIKALMRGENAISNTGLQIKYSDEEWVDVPDIEEYLYTNQPGVLAREFSTGKIYIANSVKELCKILGFSLSKAFTAAKTRGHKLHKGYQIRRGTDLSEPWPEIK